jgi:HAD superfamily hydrolase (TIGR01662 family)
MKSFDLLIFDVDGTLAEKYVLDLLPGVKDFFRLLYHSGCQDVPGLAIATNQGGVGMRRWLKQRGSRKYEKYPTEDEIEKRMAELLVGLGAPADIPIYVSYRYLTKEGSWVPVPDEKSGSPRWQSSWRKPNPGMLEQAMKDAGTAAHRTLFVGDSPDDQGAARAAGCAFAWAGSFFASHWKSCEDLERLDELTT